jgi:hypothetical protein
VSLALVPNCSTFLGQRSSQELIPSWPEPKIYHESQSSAGDDAGVPETACFSIES